MLADVIRFEWRYHTRQVSFAAAALLFLIFGFTLTATGFGPANIHRNSPYSIAQSLGMASLASVFVIAVFCANAIVRDRDYLMEEIVFTTSVEKLPFLFGRFAGSFLAAFTAFSATAIGMLIALAGPWQDPARIGHVHITAYLWPLAILVLPGMLVAGVTLFGVATLTRNIMASTVAAVAIYILYFVAAALTNSPLMAGSKPGAAGAGATALLDPFGLAPFFEQTRYWTPVQRNTALVALSGMFLLNRIVWLIAAGALWMLIYHRFSFRLLSERKEKGRTVVAETPVVVAAYHTVPTTGSIAWQWRATLAATAMEARSFVRTIPFLLLTAMWAALAAALVVADIGGGEYGSALYPTTGFVLATLQQPLTLIATIIIIYYSAEIVWRERAVHLADVVHATPAPNAVFVISKWLGLTSLVGVLVATGVGVGTVVQLAHGYTRLQPGVMLGFAWFIGAPLVVFAMAAVFIQTLIPHKYLGLLVVLLLAIVVQDGGALGLDHPIWRFDAPPPVQYSDLNGFGHFAAPFNWFLLLWAAVAGLLLAIATGFWRQAGDRRSHGLLTALRRASTPVGRRVAAALAVIAIATAAFLMYETNVRRSWLSSGGARDWRAEYEKRYRSWSSLPQPRLAAMVVDVALEPRARRCHARGTYRLVNDSATPIGTMLVSLPRDAHPASLSVAGASLAGHDSRFATDTFHFNTPLPPRGSVTLAFDVVWDLGGITASGPDNSIVANGSWLVAQRAFPVLGYRKGYELADPLERQNHGLAPLPKEERESGGDVDPDPEWIDFDATVSTDADQIALTSGDLEQTWMDHGRRYFHYRSQSPIHNNIIFASARYAAATGRSGKTVIEVLYHPPHKDNVARILQAAAESLRTYEADFGPYPHPKLTIAEVPSYWSLGGFAVPDVVYLSENRTFLIDARDPSRLDLLTRRTAHEVAHQWWGHLVTPAVAPGASTIIESLTKYSELLVLEKRYGRPAVRRSLSYELDRYAAGRASAKEDEVPLAGATDQAYLYYGKGAIVMMAIRDLIGEPALHQALRSFIADEGGPGHHATVNDLLERIDAVSSPAQRLSIAEWMRDSVIDDLAIESATSRRLADGRWQVTVAVRAAKSRIGAQGKEIAISMDDSVDVALFAGDPDGDAAPLYNAKVRLHSGTSTVVLTAPSEPMFAVVDPWITRMDRNRFDNVKRVTQ
jgi:ABC-2 type transport system permease protein